MEAYSREVTLRNEGIAREKRAENMAANTLEGGEWWNFAGAPQRDALLGTHQG
jgi:hypothetical protein